MLRFGLLLLAQLLLIKFGSGYGDIGTKNYTTTPPALCKFSYAIFKVIILFFMP